MKRPLILNVVTQMAPEGAQNAAVKVAEKLREWGYASEVWFLYTKHPGFEHLPFVRTFAPRRPSRPWEVGGLLFRLWRELRKVRPDGVITYTYYANILVQPLAWMAGVRHRLATQRNTRDLTPRPADRLDLLWGTVGVYTANVFVSRAVQQGYIRAPRAYRRRSVVVYNGIDFPARYPPREEARRRWGLPSHAWVVGYAARMDANKNHRVLLESLARLNVTEAVLVFAGEGPEREHLEALVRQLHLQDRVYFLGALSREAMPSFYASLDVFALPSLNEGFSFVLIEAMHAGCPVVASDLPVFRELAGETVYYIHPVDVEGIATVLSWIHRHPDEARARARAAVERSRQFSLDAMVKRYLHALWGIHHEKSVHSTGIAGS